MSYDELFYIHRKATKQEKTVQFNNQHWGLAGINLPETLIAETTVSNSGDVTASSPLMKGISQWSVISHLMGFYPFLVPVKILKYWRIFYIFARIHITKFMARPDYGVAIFGAGIYGIRLNNELKKRNVSVRYFIDNDENLHNTEIDGVPVISPENNETQLEGLDTIFIGSLSFMDDMKSQLKETGFKGQVI